MSTTVQERIYRRDVRRLTKLKRHPRETIADVVKRVLDLVEENSLAE